MNDDKVISDVIAGSDLLGQTVASLAAIAIVFDKVDSNYSSSLEAHARSLYT